ncbi:hypothetical protein BOTBODRAFT_165934 [Botryobasidium botryosum FD-172 SS1]|uniref:RNA helicase n=1 Tax=Botryobasidium botryosum (strain FD-172 SS1) TaxID=930990 RepID=A0A067M1A8_BOTB1|nr:hypothetical protein BOTBODRAFT_165934 [Botryobasidium botryosum FD-172 SS1]
MSDFIFTLDSEPEDEISVKEPAASSSSKKKSKESAQVVEEESALLDPEFNFDVGGGLDLTWDLGDEQDVVKTGSRPEPISVDDIIARRKVKGAALTQKSTKRKRGEDGDDLEGSDASDSEGEEESERGDESASESGEEEFGAQVESDEEGDEEDVDPLASSDEEGEGAGDGMDASEVEAPDDGEENSSSSDSEEETQAQKDRKAAFFAPAPSDAKSSNTTSFTALNLSRPLLRALTQLSFHTPTPIQSSTIPVALAGHDVLGSAVTGSGKTAAFMIPCLERLMYRQRGGAGEIRVLVLVPTRELAVQCAEVGKALARFMDLTFATIVGGLSLKVQEATLRARPDVVIATPGRLIDHLRNTPSFSLSSLDILILDEADRMLSDGFAAELGEIIAACPKARQTMLFSATMSDDVDQLVRLSMNRPVRLFVDPKKSLASGLVQEFVRVRKEEEREAVLCVLCGRTARRATIIFFRSKKLCHQMRAVFGILGMKAAELHGDLSQEQRLVSLRQFKEGKVDYLLATDVASRGLDIKGIETVINYDMPGQIELYQHRVGRTARAGKKGRSISLVGEPDRKMLKAVIKRSEADTVRHRLVPTESIRAMMEKLVDVKVEVVEVLKEEKEEKLIRQGEMEIKKGENMIEHKDEIFSRPKRTWFMTEKEKEQAKTVSKDQYDAGFSSKAEKEKEKAGPTRDKFSGLSRKVKRRKLAMEADEEFGDKGAVNASIRSAKKAALPKKIGEPLAPTKKDKKRKDKKVVKKDKTRVGKVGFDSELGQRRSGGASREGVRAKKTDSGILGGKKGKGGKGKAGGGGKRKR